MAMTAVAKAITLGPISKREKCINPIEETATVGL